MNEIERVRARLASDLKAMIADSEDLLHATASVTGDGFTAARAKFEKRLGRARTALAEASEPIFARTRESAAAADELVHTNAWTAVGIAVVAGVLIGMLTSKR